MSENIEEKNKNKAETVNEVKREAAAEAASEKKPSASDVGKTVSKSEAANEAKHEREKEFKHALKKAERKGRRKGWLARIRTFFIGILCGMLILTLFTSYMHGLKIKDTFKALFTTETAVEDRDLTLINHRIFGYKASVFQEAILGQEQELKKLEVYSREVSDEATLIQTGLGNIEAFSKYQYITFNGTAVYTVDLSKLAKEDIIVDTEAKSVTIKAPAPELEPINIPSENIEFSEVERKSIFAFGDIKLTPEEQAKVETEAKNKMVEKLEAENVIEDAKLAAEHVLWDLFQPMVQSVSPSYSLKIEFK